CINCGYTANADHVAAINILAAGHAVLARGECGPQSASVKREPTRDSMQGLNAPVMSPQGIIGLQAGEDVNLQMMRIEVILC
ncbi:MAG: hypothetical protein ACLPX5_09220, partial [Dissulfurispiraceae bacterium]